MTRTRPDIQLAATLALFAKLDARIPPLLNYLAREIATHDSLPTQTPGASPAAASGLVPQKCRDCEGAGCDNCGPSKNSPAERGTLDALRFTRDWDATLNDITTLAETSHRLLGRASKHLGPEAGATPADRCTAGLGDPTAIHWNIPECDNLADMYQRQDGGWSPRRDGLCARCYQRKARWQRNQAA